MGIRGLHTYIYDYQRAFLRDNIKKLVQEFKEARSLENNPVVVVDTPNILRPLFHDIDWHCGGQYVDYQKRLRALMKVLYGFGLDPIFFMGGIETEERRPQWFERRQNISDNIHAMIYCAEKGRCVSGCGVTESESHHIIQPALVYTYVHYALKFQFGCEVKIPTTEKNESIARYAKSRNDCFAILTCDSIYAIYNAAAYVMSFGYVDWSDWKRVRPRIYRGTLLADVGPHPSFGFDPKWLPVVGALLESDSATTLTCLFKGLRKNPRFLPVKEVMLFAEDIARRLSEAGQNLTDAPKFIIQMYGHYNQIRSHQNQLRQTLEKSIIKYSLDTPVPPELVAYSFSLDTFAKQVLEFPIVNTSVLDVLVNKECEYTNIGERTRNRNSQIPSSWDLFMPLNKYYYGLVMNDAKNEGLRLSVREFSEQSSASLHRPLQIEPEFPSFIEAGQTIDWLRKPWTDGNCVLSLILWALGEKKLSEKEEKLTEFKSKLEKIGGKYFIPGLVLHYLASKPEIKDYIGYFIRMIAKLEQGERTGKMRLCRNPSELGLQLTAIYHRGFHMISRVMSLLENAFGEDLYDVTQYFDGILFHEICRETVTSDGGSDLKGEFVDKLRELVSFKI